MVTRWVCGGGDGRGCGQKLGGGMLDSDNGRIVV